MIVRGEGLPLVLIPGIQGRWEWMAPTVAGLARRCRVASYSLCGEPGTGCRLDPERGFDAHVDQLTRVLDEAGFERATLCGVSYGGWVAVRYAARHPERVSALVLASSPGPRFRPDTRLQRYVRFPYLFLPAFAASTRQRLVPEIRTAVPDPAERRRIARRQIRQVLCHPISPGLMARRILLALREDFVADAGKVTAPTLLLTGERGLDRVVPTQSTLEYLSLIRGATAVELPRTGHIGCVTRPDDWADIVVDFADAHVDRLALAAPAQVAPSTVEVHAVSDGSVRPSEAGAWSREAGWSR